MHHASCVMCHVLCSRRKVLFLASFPLALVPLIGTMYFLAIVPIQEVLYPPCLPSAPITTTPNTAWHIVLVCMIDCVLCCNDRNLEYRLRKWH
jgi:hypothetical protein